MQETTYTLPLAVTRSWTIAHVSDLHDHPCDAVLAALRAGTPDLIAVTGDLFNRLAGAWHALSFLRGAAAIAPTFYSLGNHERLTTGDAERIETTGVRLLDDDAVYFGEWAIGGLSSGFGDAPQGNRKHTPPPNTAFLEAFAAMDGVKLLLCHHPEYYPAYIRPRPIALTLSGHAHGGQWRIAGHGVFAPGQGLFPHYDGGVYEGRLVVSRGLANTLPVPRFGNPTELVFLRIVPVKRP